MMCVFLTHLLFFVTTLVVITSGAVFAICIPGPTGGVESQTKGEERDDGSGEKVPSRLNGCYL